MKNCKLSFRTNKIKEIISFLETIKPDDSDTQYSVEQNILFFKHIFRVKDFLYWVKNYIPKIETNKLTELSDFGNEDYSRELHEGMIKVERGLIPGFISPMVNFIVKYLNNQSSDVLIADVGSGSSELARQVLGKVNRKNKLNTVIVVAFDKSESSHAIAKRNLTSLRKPPVIIESEDLSSGKIAEIKKTYQGETVVVLTRNNIFNMADDFDATTFDLSYHSFFKHHLTQNQKNEIDEVLQKVSNTRFEYDGVRNNAGLITQGLFTWKKPVLLNGAVFSNLRYPTKTQIIRKNNSDQVKIFKFGRFLSYRGTYLKINE